MCIVYFPASHTYQKSVWYTGKRSLKNCVMSNKYDKVGSLKIPFFFFVLHPNPRTLLLCYRFFIRDQRPFSARDGICMVLELYGMTSVCVWDLYGVAPVVRKFYGMVSVVWELYGMASVCMGSVWCGICGTEVLWYGVCGMGAVWYDVCMCTGYVWCGICMVSRCMQ